MAMLLDGPPSTIGDLTVRDSDLLDVSATEGIDLTAKLHLAAKDLENSIDSMLLSMMPTCVDLSQRFPALRHIAVTPQLKLWHTFATLRSVYQDVYYSRLNDRYKAKMAMYRDQESQSLDELRTVGLGVVFHPLPQAADPNVVMVSSTDAGGTVYVAVSYVNQKDEEGLASIPVEVDIPAGNIASISVTTSAKDVSAWNLFAGVSPDALYKQNSQALGLSVSATVTPDTLVNGPRPGCGQHANRLYPVPRRILRG